jgi:hypothetical protein
MIIDAIALWRRSRREFDLKPILGRRAKLSAKQAPAQFKVQCRQRSPLMGHLQPLEIGATVPRKVTGVKHPLVRHFYDKNAASRAIDMA